MEALFELIGAVLELFFGARAERGRPTPVARTPAPGTAPAVEVYRVRGRKRGRLYRGLWVPRSRR